MNIWLGENPPYESQLTDNLRIVFHSFETMNEITIVVNGEQFTTKPNNWEIVEIPIPSLDIKTIQFIYDNNLVDFTTNYHNIMFNLIYYNHRP